MRRRGIRAAVAAMNEEPVYVEEQVVKPKLRIIPLGGLEQIGMNITAYEYEDSIIIVDCGLAFPEDDMLGIDLVIPDISYLKENIDNLCDGFDTTILHRLKNDIAFVGFKSSYLVEGDQ